MGSENVEIVKRLYECFRNRDNETPFEYLDREIEWDTSKAPIIDLRDVFQGHDGVRYFWRSWLSAWEEIDFEIEDPVEIDDDQVLVFVQQRNRGKGTGIWVDQPGYALHWTLREGKVTRVTYYPAEEARRAFGV